MRDQRLSNLLLAVILLFVVARLWLMPLRSSFWVDEMGTVFVVHHGAHDPSLQAAPQVADSLYYVLPGLAESLFGMSESVYRMASVLAIAGAALLIARLAARLIHPHAGWFAVFACLTLRGFNYQASDARPYALGTFLACASLFLLIRWLDHGSRWNCALFFITAALLWRVHLIYWPFYLVFIIYAGFRLITHETPVSWASAGLTFAALGISLLPVAARAIALSREAGAHVIVPLPSIDEFSAAIKLGLVAGSCTIAVMLARWLRWPQTNAGVHSRSSLVLILCWWLCQPLALFAFSRITGNSVFVPRYLSIALPGAALVATAIAAPFIPPIRWNHVSAMLGICILAFQGHWGERWPAHHNSGWKAASYQIQQLGLDRDSPVICPSPFIEAKPPVWRPDESPQGFLYAHLPVYPIPGRLFSFPFEPSEEAENYAAQLAKRTLAASKKFVIYGGDHNVLFWREWLAARPELYGWHSRRLGPFGDVDVVVFEPAALSASSAAHGGT